MAVGARVLAPPKSEGVSMPEPQSQFQSAVASMIEAVMFENWLRFYFISEKPDAASARLVAKSGKIDEE